MVDGNTTTQYLVLLISALLFVNFNSPILITLVRDEVETHLGEYVLMQFVPGILDTHMNHRNGAQKTGNQETPGRNEYVHVAGLAVRYLTTFPARVTYGRPMPSARHTPAAPADWIPLSKRR